jgi:diguanylate cyclase (GGDEF)-like protein/PAS domain S-box-containing protein
VERRTREAEDTSTAGDAALATLLRERPAAVVCGLGADGRLTSLPPSVELRGQGAFERATALDLLVPDDQVGIPEVWRRAQVEPVIHLVVHLVARPEVDVDLFVVDARRAHGLHVVLLDPPDPGLVAASIEVVERRPRLVGRVERDVVGTFLAVDAATTSILGWPAEALVGRRSVDLIHPDDIDRAIDAWVAMRSGTGNGRVQARFRHASGRHVWVEVTNEDRLDDPQHPVVLSELVDISVEMAELEALHDRERHLQRLAEALPIGVCHLRRDRQAVYANRPMQALVGPVESIDSIAARLARRDRVRLDAALAAALEGAPSRLELDLEVGDVPRRCELTLRPLEDGHGGFDGVILCAADVTERSRLAAELEHRASHDALSGCLNREATVSVLDAALARGGVTLAYVDLDCLKAINDRCGHPAGDELLRVVAARLRNLARAGDSVGRIGGDEFVLLCPHHERPLAPADAVRRIEAALDGPVSFGGALLDLQASVGAASSTGGDGSAEALLASADAAMYDAKRRRQASRPGPRSVSAGGGRLGDEG